MLFIDEYSFGSIRKTVNWETVSCEQGTEKIKGFLRSVDKPYIVFNYNGERSERFVVESAQKDNLLAKVKEFADKGGGLCQIKQILKNWL